MTFKDFEAYVNSIIGLENSVSFATNSINIGYYSNIDQKADYYFWIDPPWRIIHNSTIIQNTYNYPHHIINSDDQVELENKDFTNWTDQASAIRNSKIVNITLNEIGDLSIYWENGYTLNHFINDNEGPSYYFYDYIKLKAYEFFPFKIEIDDLKPRREK